MGMKQPVRIIWSMSAMGGLRGVESALRIEGEITPRLLHALKGVGYEYHATRQVWFSYDRFSRLLLTDTLAALGYEL